MLHSLFCPPPLIRNDFGYFTGRILTKRVVVVTFISLGMRLAETGTQFSGTRFLRNSTNGSQKISRDQIRSTQIALGRATKLKMLKALKLFMRAYNWIMTTLKEITKTRVVKISAEPAIKEKTEQKSHLPSQILLKRSQIPLEIPVKPILVLILIKLTR